MPLRKKPKPRTASAMMDRAAVLAADAQARIQSAKGDIDDAVDLLDVAAHMDREQIKRINERIRAADEAKAALVGIGG